MSSAAVSVTYYLEILSSWCGWAEPAWSELKKRYAGRVDFRWQIALMRPQDFPISRDQCDWFYQRSGMLVRSPRMLNSGWFEIERAGHYEAPNRVAEAAKDFLGETDERVRLALSHAAMHDGRRIGKLDIAVDVATQAAPELAPAPLRAAADSAAVKDRVAASTQRFLDHQLNERPSFIIESTIGDKAVLAGTWRAEPLAAVIDHQLADHAGYAAHLAHFGPVPSS